MSFHAAAHRHVYNYVDAKKIAQYAKMCRKSGIESLKIDGNCVEFKLAPLPQRQPRRTKQAAAAPEPESPPQYSPDATLFWSSMGVGEEQPNG